MEISLVVMLRTRQFSESQKLVGRHNFEAASAKENMTGRQLGDGRKIEGGQPLRISGGKNMACPQS